MHWSSSCFVLLCIQTFAPQQISQSLRSQNILAFSSCTLQDRGEHADVPPSMQGWRATSTCSQWTQSLPSQEKELHKYCHHVMYPPCTLSYVHTGEEECRLISQPWKRATGLVSMGTRAWIFTSPTDECTCHMSASLGLLREELSMCILLLPSMQGQALQHKRNEFLMPPALQLPPASAELPKEVRWSPTTRLKRIYQKRFSVSKSMPAPHLSHGCTKVKILRGLCSLEDSCGAVLR